MNTYTPPPPLPPAAVVTTYLPPTIISSLCYHSDKYLLLTLSAPRAHLIRLKSDSLADSQRDFKGHNIDAYDVLYKFPARSCVGLTRLDQYRYVVITSDSPPILPARASVFWLVDLKPLEQRRQPVQVEKLSDIKLLPPQFNNRIGCTAITAYAPDSSTGSHTTSDNATSSDPPQWPLILLSDSTSGKIHSFDLQTKELAPWLSHPTMHPTPPNKPQKKNPFPSPLGVSDVHYHAGYVYYLNPSTCSLYRIRTPSSDPSHNAPSKPSQFAPSDLDLELLCTYKPGRYEMFSNIASRFPQGTAICIYTPYPTGVPSTISPQIYVAGESRLVQVYRLTSNGKWRWRDVRVGGPGRFPLARASCVAAGMGEGSIREWWGERSRRKGKFIWIGTDGGTFKKERVGAKVLRIDCTPMAERDLITLWLRRQARLNNRKETEEGKGKGKGNCEC